MRRASLIFASAALLCALPAAARSGEAPNTGDPCPVWPDNSRSIGNKGGGAEQKTSSGTLSGTLHPCGGVLKPPPTGDRDMTTPAPNGGNTPEIKPGEINPQQSDPNQGDPG